MHTVGHLSRSVLEGVLLNLRQIVEVCESRRAWTATQVGCRAGPPSSRCGCRLLSDVLDREVVTVTGAAEGGAYGAALVAGVGAGVWPDLSEALGRVQVERTFTPDPESQARYDVVFAAHRKLHVALTDVYALVASAEA